MKFKKVLKIIDRMQKELYRSPESYRINSAQFMFQSYKKWALNELLLYLLIRRDENPIERVEEFRYQMDVAATSATTDDRNFMFSVAYDVASDILDILLI